MVISGAATHRAGASRQSPSDTVTTDSIMPDTAGFYRMLDDVVITAVKSAVISKQDTLEYNAGSFQTSPNASVGNLLKRLPGVEVGTDGTIKSGGKTVSKILVNGKEFFGEDTEMATKNLPADLVDKVQVIDRKSDFSRLTGVDDGEEETVINLTVKKRMQNGWVGSVAAGGGTDGRYEGNFNVSTFGESNQLSVVGGANNINERGYMPRGRNFRSSGSGGIADSRRLGLNFSLGKTERLRFGGNVFYTWSDTKSESVSRIQNLFPDSTSWQNNGSNSCTRNHGLNADFRLQWEIDKYNVIDLRPKFSFTWQRAESTDTAGHYAGDPLRTQINSSESHENGRCNSWQGGLDLIYSHKFRSRPGRSFSLRIDYDYSHNDERTTTLSDIIYYLRPEDSESLNRLADSKQWSNSISGTATYTEPLGKLERGNFLELSYRLSCRFNNADRFAYDIPADGGAGILNESVSNSFRNTFTGHRLRIGYKKVSRRMNLQAGMEFAPSSNRSHDLINPERDIATKWVWNIAPFFNLRLRFSKTESLRIRYNARTTSPTLTQLQPVADITDLLNIITGNPDLRNTFTQNASVHYFRNITRHQLSLVAMAFGSYATDVVVTRNITDPVTGGRTTTYANADGNVSARAMTMVNQTINGHWRYSASLNAGYTSMAGYVNNDFNRSHNVDLSPGFSMTYTCGVFQITAAPRYSVNIAANTLSMQRDRMVHDYGFTGNIWLSLPFGLELDSDISYNRTSGYSGGYNTSSWLWNAKISYSMLHDKSLTLSVRAYDLLGQHRNVSRTVSDARITDSRYTDLTRYVMFGISWQFNTLKKKTIDRKDPDGNFPGGEPPGPPSGPPPGGKGGPPPM